MKIKLKKFVSIFLTVVMICSFVQFTAFAEEPEQEVQTVTEETKETGETKEEDISTSAVFKLETKALEVPLTAAPAKTGEYVLNDGINEVNESVEGKTFDVGEGKAVRIINTNGESTDPIIIKDCIFNISGTTLGLVYGEYRSKVFVEGNVQFIDCKFIAENGKTSGTSGTDACIDLMGDKNITFNNCEIESTGWEGQFLALYGDANVTFDNSRISTTDNVGGWSYAMYGGSVLNLINNSELRATGMKKKSGNINAFYSGDAKTNYDAINISDSTVEFKDNEAGGFAINNINIHVNNSKIYVMNNLGNASNSGMWYLNNNSKIDIIGNRCHGLSLIGIDASDSEINIMHNGYAGLYVQAVDSFFRNCTANIRCNGERLLSYSAGDVWLNKHTLSIENCGENVWLGAVGRKGTIETSGSTIVAYDLNENAGDNLKSNTEAILENADLRLNDKEHMLFLNPFMKTKYARGNGETKYKSNDKDIFKDDNVSNDKDIIGSGNAKIGTLTEAALSHHKYDWENGVAIKPANYECFGVKQYECIDVCNDYTNNTSSHEYSFDCDGTYVYAPLVGLEFIENTRGDVKNMPENLTEIEYLSTAKEPTKIPKLEKYRFTGWYTDPDCTQKFDFTAPLESNWTEVFAGWEELKGGLKVSKTVSGNAASTTKEFSFTVTLDDETINGEYGDMTFKDGKAVFKLKAGESKTANNIPADIGYKVVESDNEGYAVTAKNEEGTIKADILTEVTFDNYRRKSSGGSSDPDYVPPSKDDDDKDKSIEIVEPDVPMADALNDVDHFAYIVGRPDGNVYPETEITRAEVATIFYRLLKEDVRKELWTKENPYPDVNINDWFNVAVSVTTNGKIVHGYPDGTCRPNNSITRAEFATIAAQFLSSDYVGDDKFSDIDSHWAEKYINRAAQAGWIKGYPDGTFKPDKNITRAEAMTLINAVLGRTPDKDKFKDDMIKWPDNADASKWYYAQVQEATNSHEYDRETKETAETWTNILPVRDWEAIERAWSDIYSSVNPGEVME